MCVCVCVHRKYPIAVDRLQNEIRDLAMEYSLPFRFGFNKIAFAKKNVPRVREYARIEYCTERYRCRDEQKNLKNSH